MNQIEAFDQRRDLVLPGNKEETLTFCTEHWLYLARKSIQEHGYFAVALSGGGTPKAIFERLKKQSAALDWTKVLLFWSDERAVPPSDAESNYHMAMESGFEALPIPPQHIFRMPAEGNIEEGARYYENLIVKQLPDQQFDLVMLGMGEDGHVASLFPQTHGLHVEERAVIANYIPQKSCWRMTLTFSCINAARNIAVYVLGESKAEMLARVLSEPYEPDLLPAQRVGTATNKALWIADSAASKVLESE